jgi:hypothetical protein
MKTLDAGKGLLDGIRSLQLTFREWSNCLRFLEWSSFLLLALKDRLQINKDCQEEDNKCM